MEGLKTDIEGLTLGPTCSLRPKHFCGDTNSRDSDGLSFQLAKHRYDKREMLEIYERIEKQLLIYEDKLEKIDDLFQNELQPPVLTAQPTEEEEKALSNCVNSAAALSAFNKAKGVQSRDEKKSTREMKGNQNNRSVRSRDKEISENISKKNPDSKNKKEWKNKKESNKKFNEGVRNQENRENRPEWFNDQEDENEKSDDSFNSKLATFDENGKFVIESDKKSPSNRKAERKEDYFEDLCNDQAEINELNQKFQQAQAQLLINRMKNPSKNSDHGEKWFYLDSKNQVQGPFTSEQMTNWLASGYFSMSLMVKRGCDEKFVPLGLIVQNLNQMALSSQKSNPKSHDQLFQQMQQLNNNNSVLQSHLVDHQKSGLNNSDMAKIIQQIQQIQIQQKAAVSSLNSLGVNVVAAILQDLRNKQENLISQINITKQNSPIINSLLQQTTNQILPQVNEKQDPLKDKILALFEIKRQEERRRLEEELRIKQKEEKKRMEEARIKQLILMSNMAQQQNLEQQTLDQKLLLEQIKLKEALNGQPNSVLGGFLRKQQQSSNQLNSLANIESSIAKTEINNNDLWTDFNIQQGATSGDFSSKINNITSLLSGLN